MIRNIWEQKINFNLDKENKTDQIKIILTEDQMRSYTMDHWKVLEVLSKAEKGLKAQEIAKKGFMRREQAERVVRNAFRKLKAAGHINQDDRGSYVLTTAGKNWFEQAKSEGYKPIVPGKKEAKVKKGKSTPIKKALAKGKEKAKKTLKEIKKEKKEKKKPTKKPTRLNPSTLTF